MDRWLPSEPAWHIRCTVWRVNVATTTLGAGVPSCEGRRAETADLAQVPVGGPRLLLAAAVLVLAALASGSAWAEEGLGDAARPLGTKPPEQPAAATEWSASARQYRRFGIWDGVTVAAGAAVALTSTLVGPPAEPRWQGGIWFDGGVRSALRATSRAGRDRARAVGDVTYISGALLPTVLDGLIVTLGVQGDADAAGQMLLINLQAYAVAGALLIGSENLVARARPSVKPCAEDGNYEAFCGDSDEKSSFISGHTGVVATSAGLLCAHHQYLDLYGNELADATACGLGIGLALTTGVARIINDRHYATDTLAAFAVGALSGYVLPVLTHYSSASPAHERASRWSIAPLLSPTTAGLRLSSLLD